MARERMVTRTAEITKVQAMCLTISTATVETKEYTLTGKFETTAEMLKAVKKKYETADFKPSAIIHHEVSEILYGMPESKFIELAQVLPPRKSAE